MELGVRGLECHTQELGCDPGRGGVLGEVTVLMAASLTVQMMGGARLTEPAF